MKLTINHEKIGKYEVEASGNGLTVFIENRKVKAYVKRFDQGSVLSFYKKEKFSFGEIAGIKINEDDKRNIKTLIENMEKDEINKELLTFKNKKSLTFLITDGMHITRSLGYSNKIISIAQEKIINRYKNETKVENVETIAGSVSKYIIEISGVEIIEILEETKKEIELKSQEKQNVENKRIEDLKELAKKTGERQIVSVTSDDCNDDNEACEIDTITEYVNADGTFTVERTHSW